MSEEQPAYGRDVSVQSELNPYPLERQNTTALILDGNSMDKMMTLAECMAGGVATIPEHLQKNKADCLAVIMQAMQWNMNPWAVAQKTHTVKGKLGYEAQLVNAVVTSLAPTQDRLHYEWTGDWNQVNGKFKEMTGNNGPYRVPDWKLKDEEGLGVKVWATLKGEEEPRVHHLLLTQARTRNSTLWADNPQIQLAYLAIKQWARLHCPDVILGVYTRDELESSTPMREINPRPEDESKGRATAEDARKPITTAQLGQLRKAMEMAGVGDNEFCNHRAINIDQVENLPQARFKGAMTLLQRYATKGPGATETNQAQEGAKE